MGKGVWKIQTPFLSKINKIFIIICEFFIYSDDILCDSM